jgi:2-polyprenyl-6-methoxyphenol hydroxylase-like FAD-dependent oxidoreductase
MAYDAIIVGSRVAGSATAMLLARCGHRVLVVDRATFPSDTISTHIIWQQGVNRLIEWGLEDRLKALNAPPITTLELDPGPGALRATLPPVGRATTAYAPRRKLLDKMLLDAAGEAGAEIREGFGVEEVVFDGDRVAGIRGRGRSNGTIEERAKIVIGADGVYSTLARAVQAPEYNVKPALACWYYSYWSGIFTGTLRFFSRAGRAFGLVPTNDGLLCIAVAWPKARFEEVRADIENHYLGTFDLAPASVKEEVRSARREERFYGIGHVPNYFRKPYGPGWALVGDAGYHKDPILAQGISDAFRDASLLSEALDDVFAGRAGEDEALAGYESTRNKAVEAIYEMNAEYAALEKLPPEMETLIAALRDNQEDTNRFAGTMTGAVPVTEFYAPENVNRIVAGAQQWIAAGSD